MRPIRQLSVFTLLAVAILLSSCGKHKPSKGAVLTKWEPYVSAFTSGVISRESVIRIRLTAEAVPESLVNVPLDKSPVSLSPGVKGTALWVERGAIEFRPSERLKAGQKYEVSFDIGRYVKAAAGLGPFTFPVMTMRQSLTVQVEGLKTIAANDLKWQQCAGTVVTADAENGDDVEKVLTARQNGNNLHVRWEHTDDRRTHRFVVDSIQRGDAASEIELSWNGRPIGVDLDGGQKVHVPALDEFTVIDAQTIQGEQQHVVIRFSDPLERKQDLRGLINLGGDEQARFTIDRNEVHAYPSKRLTGQIAVVVRQGVRNIAGRRIKEETTVQVTVENIKPSVRFPGKGTIIPSPAGLIIPFEAVNLSAVDVRAVRIYESNIRQFLQVNDLEGTSELRRVGRVAWKKTVKLDLTPDMRDRWIRCGFDATPLLSGDPGALYRIELSFRKAYSQYPCGEDQSVQVPAGEQDLATIDKEDDEDPERSNWDFAEDVYEGNYNWDEYYQNKDNPCHPAYYRETYDHKVRAGRNFLSSNIGIIAKQGTVDTMTVTVTDLQTAQPLGNADVVVYNFQNQPVGRGKTGGDGMCPVALNGKPHLVTAENGKQKGYLRVDEGSNLSVSQFDVGGSTVPRGLKGCLYGERGVWRPGDTLFLTFTLEDKTGRLPQSHPATLELVNPRGQVVQTVTRAPSVDRFYNFTTITAADAPTGNYTARVKVGGATFEQQLKIETVMPNRLKVKLDFGTDTLKIGTAKGTLSSRWLHGAIARNLKADVEMTLQAVPTQFSRYGDCIFDDPVRKYTPETQQVFDGRLDAEGNAAISLTVEPQREAPGMLRASFRSRVFEEGGAFSVDRFTLPYSPFKTYVGIQLPKGDRSRGMLLTDTTHTVRVATVSPSGAPVSARRIQIKLYKVEWRWWWEKGEESMADYVSSENHKPIKCDTVSTRNGEGAWTFRVNYPEWGRFLVRAVDLDGGHATGTFCYIDWPGWAGKARPEQGGGATVLSFSSDKDEYAVGEKAKISIPSSEHGRILLSVENGSRVLRQTWVDAAAKETRFDVDITEDMTPNVYVSAIYIQPYAQTVNDLPIRMYGVIPLRVVFPRSKLAPKIEAPDVLEPNSKAVVAVSEASGRDMTYTVAIVDEGLLDLTRFETPDLWKFFNQREALGVRTWDLFDLVCGAYGAKLERLLSIGGDMSGAGQEQKKRSNRFPPMVRFIGPFHLNRGKTDRHEIDVPQYVGSVRIMVVAGLDGAYGSTDKTVPVRKPLMVLGTLPRVLGPKETVKLPVTVFAMEKNVRDVRVSVSVKGQAMIAGEPSRAVRFDQPGDETVTFELSTGAASGWLNVHMEAAGGGVKAAQDVNIMVRNPNGPQTVVLDTVLQSGQAWNARFDLPGVEGSNSALLEVSRVPPLNLGKRLDYLITYPHGCVEQTTSSVFPQLYLDKLLDLSSARKSEIQKNVQAGIDRLREFQVSNGGFCYWPGGGDPEPWASNYAGHFILEARLAGYSLPSGMLEQWTRYQRASASSWNGRVEQAELIQSYRLYTLALAGSPDLGSMNRLCESRDLPVSAKWRLAAAYQLAGQSEAAQQLVKGIPTSVKPYKELAWTYGSDLRDRAMIMETMVLMKDLTGAAELAKAVSRELCTEMWMSTQTTAYALLAIAKFTGASGVSGKIDVAYRLENGKDLSLVSPAAVAQQPLELAANAVAGSLTATNRGPGIAYVRLIMKGIPAVGEEKATEQGLALSVKYYETGADPREVDPAEITQGTDFIAEVTLGPQAGRGPYKQVALAQIFPSGWEIRNTRFEGAQNKQSAFDYQDIRDDRVYTYCDLSMNQSKTFRVQLNAAYLGSYYLPSTSAEAMYDASISALEPGRWVKVVEAGK